MATAGRPTGRTTGRRALLVAGRTALLVVLAALALAACSGSAEPKVASLAKNRGGGTVTTLSPDNATRLLVEWASCMRSHGDPDQVDPSVDQHWVINIRIPVGAESLSNEVHNGTAPCNDYLAAASAALQAAHPVPPGPDEAQLVKFAACMRANGVPNYPDPSGNRTSFNGGGVDPNSPIVRRATTVCGTQMHLASWWVSGTGRPGEITVFSGPSGGPPKGGVVPAPGG